MWSFLFEDSLGISSINIKKSVGLILPEMRQYDAVKTFHIKKWPQWKTLSSFPPLISDANQKLLNEAEQAEAKIIMIPELWFVAKIFMMNKSNHLKTRTTNRNIYKFFTLQTEITFRISRSDTGNLLELFLNTYRYRYIGIGVNTENVILSTSNLN